MKFLITFTLISFTALSLQAGNNNIINNEQLLLQHLNQSVCPNDTSAQALILFEKGTSFISDGYLKQTIERVVKIYKKDAASDFATINIGRGSYTSVTKIKGITYNLENDAISKQEITKADILKDAIDRDISVAKFNLPSVKEGSIIYYTYTTNNPGWLMIPDWTFQSEYPTLESVYEIAVPQYIAYVPIERVETALTKVEKSKDLESCQNCSFQNTVGGMVYHTWVRNNIEAFKKEPFMSSAQNFKERVKIHIAAYRGSYYDIQIYNNWSQINKRFYYENEETYGQVFTGNRFLQDQVDALAGDKKDDLAKAKAIYAYVRDSIKTKQSVSGSKASYNIREVLNKKEGSRLGVNLLLIAMLRRAGLESEPVLLATRGNERLNELYPDPDNINYAVAKIKANQQEYFLDASERYMPFGFLLPDCYNGYCRIVNETGGAASLEPEHLRNKTTVMVTISNADTNKLRLKVDQQLGFIQSLSFREGWAKDTSAALKMIKKEIAHNTFPTTLDRYSIEHLDNPDLPLTIHYEATMDFNHEASTIYFDPYFFKFFEKNPFSAVSRKYTVEMNYLQDVNYIFRFQLPKDYEVDDYPQSSGFQFGEEGLMNVKNVCSYNKDDNTLSLNCKFSSRTATFHPALYQDLRSFYERVIEEQNKKIVIKKIIH